MKKVMLFIVCLAVMVSFAVVPSFGQMRYKEAPMLAELVKAGKLPPVEERLPKKPLVLSGEWNEIPKGNVNLEIGQYGGTLRIADPGAGAAPEVWSMNNEPPLSVPGIDTMGGWQAGLMRGNVLESFEVSRDNKVFTFRIREGLRWSDGTPVTTDDVRFHYEDFLMNDKLTPVFPAWAKAGGKPTGKPMRLEVIDKYTFRISFEQPYVLFPLYLSLRWNSFNVLLTPSHYMKQFHVKYTPLEKLQPILEREGFGKDEWWRLYSSKNFGWSGRQEKAVIGFPTLQPWVYVGQPSPNVNIFERNPYYFKVDAAGNQLPYIDRLRVEVVVNRETATMKTIAGEVDFSVARTNVTDYPVLKENAGKSGYRVGLLGMHVTSTDIFLNLTHPDPVWRKVVRDIRFRKALNMGIDRQGIIDAVQNGIGSVPTKAKMPDRYDPAAANKLLDEMGLDKRDADGWRLGPDGKRFEIPFEGAVWTVGTDKVVELVMENWRNLGIYTTMKVIETGLASARRLANEQKATSYWLDWAVIWDYNPTAWFTAPSQTMFDWGTLWRDWWVSEGKTGEAPPPEVKKFLDLYETVVSSSNAEERRKAIEDTYRLVQDQVFFFVIAESKYPAIFAKNLRNTPHAGYGIEGQFSGEQFFFKQ
jgi:peptide/nickel transport system substrate-binding protein